MSRLEEIIGKGNFFAHTGAMGNRIRCEDGFEMSVIAGTTTYCTPRPGWGQTPDDYQGPYRAVEVGFPSERPEPWETWEEYCQDPEVPTKTIYGYVPVDLVRQLIETHGGEK